MKKYLVGGSVRDQLLQLPNHDNDWVIVGTTPKELLKLGYKQVGKDFPVFLHPVSGEEYALARTERKSGKGYTGFFCYSEPDVTLEQDLYRRDLTINAIAQDEEGQFIDPYCGIADLKSGILRHVSSAFTEDPLRVLRTARFAAKFYTLGFSIAPETINLMTAIVNHHEIQQLTSERVWKETEKALSTRHPEIYFYILRQCGAFQILFPEIETLFSIEYHCVNLGKQALQTLKNSVVLTDDINLRFAMFCHNLVADADPKIQENTINKLSRRLKLPVIVKELITLFNRYYKLVATSQTLNAEQLLTLFNQVDVWRKPWHLSQLILCVKADKSIKLHDDFSLQTYLEAAYNRANSIQAKEVIQDGYTHSEIRQQLNIRRIAALRQWIDAK